jgi:hypothetical protein
MKVVKVSLNILDGKCYLLICPSSPSQESLSFVYIDGKKITAS